MRSVLRKLSTWQATLILLAVVLIAVLLRPGQIQAQRGPAPAVAQVGVGSPLPVYVVNDPEPALPVGFIPGSSWKFTTWTTPSTLTFTATVQKTEGGWAFLALSGDAATTPKWYYVPHMPGAWEPQ
jgi:hypothetical protein